MVEAGKNGHPEESTAAADSAQVSPELLRTFIHELRNPLGPIRNAAELLRTLCTDPRQLQSVDIIVRQVSSMTRALEDLTGAVGATQSQLLLSRQVVDLAQIVEPALQVVRPEVDARRQNLLVSLPNEPVRMNCDPPRLTQVTQTLLENASRHTPAGGSIALQVSLTDRHVLIEVRDDGAGMASEQLGALFNVFSQRSPSAQAEDPADSNLVIVRNIVEMHGGVIEAFSEGIGRGSRFAVTLPLADDVGGPPSPQKAAPADALKVIIIDDHEDSMTSLRDVLAAAGHEVLVASSGELGLALAEKFHPDAVIVDIGLPGMDGFEVARHLHESSVTGDALLIAVSGFSLKQFRDLSAYSVFRHYLLKPASPETILAIIEGGVRRRTSLAKKK